MATILHDQQNHRELNDSSSLSRFCDYEDIALDDYTERLDKLFAQALNPPEDFEPPEDTAAPEEVKGTTSTDIAYQDSVLLDMTMNKLMHDTMHPAEETFNKVVLFINWHYFQFQTLPPWLQDNDYIWDGYRPLLPSWRDCFKSIFSIHTETGNVWTHMLACIFFVALSINFLSSSSAEISVEDKLVLSTLFVGTITCMGLSAFFHAVICHSEWAFETFSKMDYVGISVMIIGSGLPLIYYSFYCDTTAQIAYTVVIIVFGSVSIFVSTFPQFGTTEYRPIRTAIFTTFAISGVLPTVHFLISAGWSVAFKQASLGWLMLTAALNGTGSLLYTCRIPERFAPGMFDLFFHSHQVFHTLVVCGAVTWYWGVSEMAVYRLTVGQCPVAFPETVQ